jgi:hypothetical protein
VILTTLIITTPTLHACQKREVKEQNNMKDLLHAQHNAKEEERTKQSRLQKKHNRRKT